MVMVALAMTALLLFGALAIDVGAVWASRSQSQNAGDAAALSAAQAMIWINDENDPVVRLDGPDGAIAQGVATAALNATVGNPAVTVVPGDFQFGFWDLETRTLDTTVDTSNHNLVTGVRVTVRMDGAANNRSPSFFSGLLGLDGFEVRNTAVAYRGFQGTFRAGEFNLPIAISSCVLSGEEDDHCGSDFCEMIDPPHNPMPLDEPQDTDDDGDVDAADVATEFTELQFENTEFQNACWTEFDPGNVDANDVRDLIETGNSPERDAGDAIGLSNGDVSNAVMTLEDRLDEVGVDRYAGGPPGPPPGKDSWVVKLPVVECQEDDHCAGGDDAKITGAVCFEIREVLGPPDKRVRGRFLCPDSPDRKVRDLFEEFCREPSGEVGGPGGCNFGFHADKVVLVQ
jgi:hypothetical protein